MPPVVLLAELLAHGFDIEIRDNILTYIGDFNQLSPTLLADLDGGQRELNVFIISGMQRSARPQPNGDTK